MSSLQGKTISRTYQKLIQSDGEITDSSLKQISTGEGVPVSLKLSTTKAEVKKLGIGTDGASPDGLLHVLEVGAGAITASTSGNQLTLENSTNCGLSILSGPSNYGNIFFGSTSGGNDSGSISYDHSNDSMTFSSGGEVNAVLDKSGNLAIGGTLSESEDRYTLTERFENLPVKNIQNTITTQQGSNSVGVINNSRIIRIVTYPTALAANDSFEFELMNSTIEEGSHVLIYIIDSSGTIADNAIVSVMAHNVRNSYCDIRVATNGVAVDSQTYTLQVIVDSHKTSNSSWSISGEESGDWQTKYSGAYTLGGPGLKLMTFPADNKSTILHPKGANKGIHPGGDGFNPVPNESAWSQGGFSSTNEMELQIPMTTSYFVSDMGFWAGYKKTSTGVYTTDSDQAYFLYSSDDTLGTITNNSNLHFVYSIDGVDYVTDLGIAVSTHTTYRLKMVFDEEARLSVFVNGVQYGLTHTPTTTTAGGVTESNSTKPSIGAITHYVEDTSNPELSEESSSIYIAAETYANESKDINVHFVKASRKF